MIHRILVTGANGFLGRAVVRSAAASGLQVRAAVRQSEVPWPAGVRAVEGLDLGAAPDWRPALEGIDAIVHCAARVHVMADTAADPLAEFRRINTAGTLALARQAAMAGVRRFVFVSSIGVNGAETAGTPYRADDPPAPHSPYAVSKHEAELGLRDAAIVGAMEVVILRPPLIYGPDAPGNFASLMRVMQRGLPLPFGAVDNRRSFVGLDNLVHLILLCLDHAAAAGQTFLASDGEDLSTTQLLARTAHALGRPARLLPVPAGWLRAAANALGKRELAQRLFGSLEVDIGKTRTMLGWTPPVSVDEGLRRTAQHFLNSEVARRAA